MTRSMTNYFAIGDIHGQDALLAKAHTAISAHAQRLEGKKILVHLGDYIDRGPRSRQVIERLMQGLENLEVINLKGNHEQMMLDFLTLPSPAMSRHWLAQGGWETAASYGVKYSLWDKYRFKSKHEELLQAIPKEQLEWLRKLPVMHKSEAHNLVFAHAGIHPERSLDEQTPEVLMWIRYHFLDADTDYGFRVVHGHTPSSAVDVKHNRINLDPGLGKLRFMFCDGEQLQLFQVSKWGVKLVFSNQLSAISASA